jgi:hypothetical protein
MITLEDWILIILVVVALIYSARKTAVQKSIIKKRANHEINKKIDLTQEEFEIRLGKAELMYENLEQSYWAHVGLLVGIISYLYWHVWYLSLVIGVTLMFIGYKFLSFKPFTSGVADIPE